MLQGSSALSEFRTSLSKVLTLWHCIKVKQHYQGLSAFFAKIWQKMKENLVRFADKSMYVLLREKSRCIELVGTLEFPTFQISMPIL